MSFTSTRRLDAYASLDGLVPQESNIAPRYDMDALDYGHQFEDVLTIRTAEFRDEPVELREGFRVPHPAIFTEDQQLQELFEALRKRQATIEDNPEPGRQIRTMDSSRVTVASSFQVGHYAQPTIAAETRRVATLRQLEAALADNSAYPLSADQAGGSSNKSPCNRASSDKGAPVEGECLDCPVCSDVGGTKAFVTGALTRPIGTCMRGGSVLKEGVASPSSPNSPARHKKGLYMGELHVDEEASDDVSFTAPANHRLTLPLSDWLTGGKNGSAAHGDCGLFLVSVPPSPGEDWNFGPPKDPTPLPADVHLLGSVPIQSRTCFATLFCELGFAEVTEKFVFGYADEFKSFGANKMVRFKYTLPPNAMFSGMKSSLGSGLSKREMGLRPRPADTHVRQASWKGLGSVRRRQVQLAAQQEAEAKKKKRAEEARRTVAASEGGMDASSKPAVRASTGGAVRFNQPNRSVSFAGAAANSAPHANHPAPRFSSSSSISASALRPSLSKVRRDSASVASRAPTVASSVRYIPDGAVGDGPNTLSVDLGCLTGEATCSVEVKYLILMDTFDNSFKFSHIASWVRPNEGHASDVNSYPITYHIHMVAQPDSIRFVDLGNWSGGMMGADMLPSVHHKPDGTTWWLMQRTLRQRQSVLSTHIIVDMRSHVRTRTIQVLTQKASSQGVERPISPPNPHSPPHPSVEGQETRVAFIKARVKPMEDDIIQDGISVDGRNVQDPKQPRLDIWLLMDVSGSMSGGKMEALRVVAKNFVKAIPTNRGVVFNMVAMREECEVWSVEGSTPFSEVVKEDALRAINDVVAGGTGSLLGCLKEMYSNEKYAIPPGHTRRVFLISDGVTSEGEAVKVYDIVRDRESPVAMSTAFYCVGVGMLGGGELAHKLLTKVTQKTGGMMVCVEPSHDLWSRCRTIVRAVLSRTLTMAPSLQLPSNSRYHQPPGQLPGLVRPGQNISMLVKVYESQPGDILTLRLTERPGKSLKLFIPMAPPTPFHNGSFPLTFRRTAWDAYEGGEPGLPTGYMDDIQEGGGTRLPVSRIRSGAAFSQLHAMICLTNMMRNLSSIGDCDARENANDVNRMVEAAEKLAEEHCLMTPMSYMAVEVKMTGLAGRVEHDEYFDPAAFLEGQNHYPHVVPYHVQRLPASRMTAGDPLDDAPEFGRITRETSEGLIRMLKLSQRGRGAWLAEPDMHLKDSEGEGSILMRLVETFSPKNTQFHGHGLELTVIKMLKARPALLNEHQWVTLIVLAFLTKHMMHAHDQWELMEANAWVWLRQEWPRFPDSSLYRAGDKASSFRTLAVSQAARMTATIGHCVMELHHLIP